MTTTFRYIFFLVLSASALLSQNTNAIKECVRDLRTGIPDQEKIRLSLTLATEFTGYKNDSALYYVAMAKSFLQKNKNAKDAADADYIEALIHYSASEYYKAQLALNQCVIIAKMKNDKPLLSKAYNLLGAICFNLGNYSEAIHQYDNELFIAAELKDTVSIIETFYNFSLINNAEGAYFQSLENNYTALKLAEKTKDSLSMMIACEGLGLSYYKVKDYTRAIIYLKKAFQMAVIRKRRYEQSGILVDIGNVYREMQLLEKAAYYYDQAIKIASSDGDRLVESIAISEKGSVFFKRSKFTEAISLFDQAIKISTQINHTKGIAENYRKIAECDLELSDYSSARTLASRSLIILQKTVDKIEQGRALEILSRAYEKSGNIDSAYVFYKLFVASKDSSENKITLRKISDYESKYQRDKLERERALEERRVATELLKQKQIRNSTLAATGLVLLMLLIAYKNYRLKEKANIEVNAQKKEIELKTKDIVDSVNYSKRLREAMLASHHEIKSLFTNSFLIYEPKEIIGGNVYFIERSGKDKIHIGVGDARVSGIPGAFMSIIAYGILKQALKKPQLETPGEILSLLCEEMRPFFSEQKKEGKSAGLDLLYCCIEQGKMELSYASLGLPLFISSTQKIEGSDLVSIGRNGENYFYKSKGEEREVAGEDRRLFPVKKITLHKEDTIYFITAGNLPEIGTQGESNRLLEFLIQNLNLSISEQEKCMQNEINELKKAGHDLGDVCIIGIKA